MRKILPIIVTLLSIQCYSQSVIQLDVSNPQGEELQATRNTSEILVNDQVTEMSSIDFSISGGSSPYIYSWLQNDSIISNNESVSLIPATGNLYSLLIYDTNNCSVEVSINTSESDISIVSVDKREVQIYPTQVTNELIINLAAEDMNASVSIYDLKGLQLKEQNILGSSTLNLDLLPGVYFVNVLFNNKRYSEKITVK